MRAFRCGFALVVFGLIAACSGTDDDTGAGSSGGSPSGTGGTGGTVGGAGSSSGGAHSGASGGANDGGTSGGAGVPNGGGTSGTAGTVQGGMAGEGNAAGAPGTTDGGAGNEAGAPNPAGEGGTMGEAGADGDAGAAGHDSGGAGASGAPDEPIGLSWPIDCIPDETCVNLDYPDIDEDGEAHDCGEPGYLGHQGTDIGITFAAQAAGTAVRAAADGVVLFAFDGKYDQCPNADEPDCQNPPDYVPGATAGTTVCTPVGPYCGTGEEGCFWCFAGGNVIVIRHENVPGVFATRYDHLKKGSVLVQPGDVVERGQKIAEAASAGNSTGPHLHFEVWGTGFYELADPWAGPCGPNTGPSLWAYDPPWAG
ncbi:MAG TPA: M23 family metallopeptidase [Polyangiaceae bacterium]|nr:M23 family metallopeptidase [Polyangiaceae bacterium]